MDTLFNKIKRHAAAILCALVFLGAFVYSLIIGGVSLVSVVSGIIAASLAAAPLFLAAGIEHIYNK